MLHLKPFPIRINGSFHDERARNLGTLINTVTGTKAGNALHKVADSGALDVVSENSDEAHAYEKSVGSLLAGIARTHVGTTLLRSITEAGKTVWIVPYDSTDRKESACNSYVWEYGPDRGGGIRVMFSLDLYGSGGACRGLRPDVTLVHELVHAFRVARLGLANLWRDKMKENANWEEFFAVHVANVYISNTGRTSFRRVHGPALKGGSTAADLAGMHKYFSTDVEAINAMHAFTRLDPLGRALTQLKAPTFNPFRDILDYSKKQSAQEASRGTGRQQAPTTVGRRR